MLRHRLILTLLLDNSGTFYNSRDFRLQAVGQLSWISRYINFDAIDELIVLNVDRQPKSVAATAAHIRELGKRCFVPIAAGGGVKSISDFETLLDSGCDKIVVNTAAHDSPNFVSEAARRFGNQCVVASVDVLRGKAGWQVVVSNGELETGIDVLEYVSRLERMGAGEIYLTSIDRDGTGLGYDLELIQAVARSVGVPVIASGGVGTFAHLVEGISTGRASAVSAANIFHHIGDSLKKAKSYISEQGVDVPMWNFWDGMEQI